MAKSKTAFVCQSCGAVALRWSGRCSECGEWNTIHEETLHDKPSGGSNAYSPAIEPITAPVADFRERMSAGSPEFDRVLGGGIVPGSLTLLGGDPGIGKSTIMLQVSHRVAECEGTVLYVSGEESFEQTRMRASRLGRLSDRLLVLTDTDIDSIRNQITNGGHAMAIIDSIQSIFSPDTPGVPGSVAQVRECANALLRVAKTSGIPIFLVGHVTKEGAIAGPRLLEHLVDTVLYFEGEGSQALRILRAVKNRFGSTHEIGVFEMTETGLVDVPNPSALFLNERPHGASGSVVFPSIEGTRPLLVEVQALVTEAYYGSSRRTVSGLNLNRVNLALAVLEKRAGMRFSDKDVFVNVVGGVRIDEPAADLALALALVSSLLEIPVPQGLAAFGELGLAGEVRGSAMARRRVNEARKFGFNLCVLPKSCMGDFEEDNVSLLPVRGVRQAIDTALDR